MFEQTLEDMTATIFIEDREARILDAAGVATFNKGSLRLNYQEAADLVERMKRLQSGVPKHEVKRYTACLNSIKNAFGPEFWERH